MAAYDGLTIGGEERRKNRKERRKGTRFDEARGRVNPREARQGVESTEKAPRGANYIKMGRTENEYRFRLRDPDEFDHHGLSSGQGFAPVRSSDYSHAYKLIGMRNGHPETQSIRFKREYYTESEAKKIMRHLGDSVRSARW
jgi:hypothetical protein